MVLNNLRDESLIYNEVSGDGQIIYVIIVYKKSVICENLAKSLRVMKQDSCLAKS